MRRHSDNAGPRTHRVLSVTLGCVTAAGIAIAFALSDRVIAFGQSMLYAMSGGQIVGTQVTPSAATIAIMTAIMLVSYIAVKTLAEGICVLWDELATAGETALTALGCVIGMIVLSLALPMAPNLATSAGPGAVIVALLILLTCLLRPDIGGRTSLLPLERRASARSGSPTKAGEIRDSSAAEAGDEATMGTPDWQGAVGAIGQEELQHAGDTHDCDDGHQPGSDSGDDVQPPVAHRDRVPQGQEHA